MNQRGLNIKTIVSRPTHLIRNCTSLNKIFPCGVMATNHKMYCDLSQRRSPSKYKTRNHFEVPTPKHIYVNMTSSLIPLHGKRR